MLLFRMQGPGRATAQLLLPLTPGLVLLQALLLAAATQVGLQPLGGGALLRGQDLLRPVPQDSVLCKAKWGSLGASFQPQQLPAALEDISCQALAGATPAKSRALPDHPLPTRGWRLSQATGHQEQWP